MRAELERVGFHPSRRLGQNFLLDENMVRAIVRDAAIDPGERVLEVGPGCGFLSLHLAAAGAELLCVEVDRRLAEVSRAVLAGFPNAKLLCTDVLAGKHRLAPEVDERLPTEGDWHLVSNLPYAVASPVMAVLARRDAPPRSMTVLVQREVADRLAAEPGTPEWGPLGVKLGLTYRAERTRLVPAGLFWPRPKVESAVVRLELRTAAPSDAGDAGAVDPAWVPGPGEAERFDRLVDGLFQRRRKTLLAGLAGFLGDREEAERRIAAAGLDPSVRAEQLALGALRTLAFTGRD